MAQRVQVLMTDDLDGGEADETVFFALDGSSYEMDLSVANAQTLRNAIAPYVGVARRSGRAAGRSRAGSPGPRSAAPSGSGENAAIREWANAHGHRVSARGRISVQVRDAYAAATS